MASIRLEHVVKQFENGHIAVRDANLEIADGEFLVLVGPSGCGKSTTLRMVAGLEEVTDGKIFIGDRCVNDVEPGKRDIAMVFQNYALYPHMTVRENLSFGLKMRRAEKSVIHQRVTDAAEALSIETLLDRRPRELSGGQRQRVAVGRALVRDPAAFLLDEPLSNLDARLRIQMRKELAQLHHRLKTTTLYVTHDQVEAMTLGQRIVVMNQGEIQQVATPMELYDQPANRFVAGFIGSPAMNLVEGEIETRDGHPVFCNPSMNYPVQVPESGLEPGPVCFGFRPEHVTLNRDDPKLADVTIDVVERLGNETIVYYEITGHACIATMDGKATVSRGDQLTLRLPATRSYLFSADSGGQSVSTSHSVSDNT